MNVEKLAKTAHQVCLHSNAKRPNVDVELAIVRANFAPKGSIGQIPVPSHSSLPVPRHAAGKLAARSYARARSKRSASMTLVQAATKSVTNFVPAVFAA